jgi:hypothetical protein
MVFVRVDAPMSSAADRRAESVGQAVNADQSWIWHAFHDFGGPDGSVADQDSFAGQVEVGAPEHLAFDHFDAVAVVVATAQREIIEAEHRGNRRRRIWQCSDLP